MDASEEKEISSPCSPQLAVMPTALSMLLEKQTYLWRAAVMLR
jgi:hypothetical protein